MSPEQARGELDHICERADVFGLGSIMCEVLTGQPALIGRSGAEVMRKAARGELAEAFARLDACGAELELVAVAKHCLAAEREDRPRNAREVADAITSYLAGVQERLRQTELARVEANARTAEERKRRKVTLALAASVIGTIVLAGGAWYWNERQRHERAARVDLALRDAEILHDQARQSGDDLTRWVAARDAAHSVDLLLADARDEQTLRKVKELGRAVTEGAVAAEDDRKLLDKLINIRSTKFDDPDGLTTDAAYTVAFREAGIDLAVLPAADVARRSKPGLPP